MKLSISLSLAWGEVHQVQSLHKRLTVRALPTLQMFATPPSHRTSDHSRTAVAVTAHPYIQHRRRRQLTTSNLDASSIDTKKASNIHARKREQITPISPLQWLLLATVCWISSFDSGIVSWSVQTKQQSYSSRPRQREKSNEHEDEERGGGERPFVRTSQTYVGKSAAATCWKISSSYCNNNSGRRWGEGGGDTDRSEWIEERPSRFTRRREGVWRIIRSHCRTKTVICVEGQCVMMDGESWGFLVVGFEEKVVVSWNMVQILYPDFVPVEHSNTR